MMIKYLYSVTLTASVSKGYCRPKCKYCGGVWLFCVNTLQQYTHK